MKRTILASLMLITVGARAGSLVVDPLPAEVRAGDPVTVTGRVVGVGPLDLVFLLDRSGSIDTQEAQAQRDYALALADGLAHDTGSVMSAIVTHAGSAGVVLPLSGSGQAVHAAIQTLAPSGGTSCVSCGLRLANDVFADSTRDGQATLGRLALLFTDDAPGNELPVDYVPAYTALHKTGVTLLGIALPGIPTADRNALANATNVVASSGFADVYDLGDGPGALYQSILALVGFPTVDYSLHLSTGTVFGSVAVAADGSFALPTVAVAEGGTFWSLQATNRLGATISRGATVYATPVPLPPGALLMLAPLAALARPARQPNAARY